MSAFTQRLRPLAAWLVGPSSSRRQQVACGVMWLAAGDGLGAILGFVKLAIIARLLAPADFGLFAIALLTTGWLEVSTTDTWAGRWGVACEGKMVPRLLGATARVWVPTCCPLA